MKNVIIRSISGAVYVALVIGAILLGKEAFAALTLLFIMLAVIEASRLFQGGKPLDLLTMAVDVAGGIAVFIGLAAPYIFAPEEIDSQPQYAGVIPFTLYLLVRLTVELFMNRENPLDHLRSSVLAIIYAAFPLSLMYVLYNTAGYKVVLAMFIFIWLNDTGAFCVGSLLGRHKLFPRVSPKKSWEGVWGGLAFCIIAGALFGTVGAEYFGDDYIRWIIIGFTTAVLATIGDLVESLFKRTVGVKDSGNIMPGHGGILDRLDSLLFVAPATLCLLFFY